MCGKYLNFFGQLVEIFVDFLKINYKNGLNRCLLSIDEDLYRREA